VKSSEGEGQELQPPLPFGCEGEGQELQPPLPFG